jgi:hypothetical protein
VPKHGACEYWRGDVGHLYVGHRCEGRRSPAILVSDTYRSTCWHAVNLGHSRNIFG